ncbi:hypothetical protein CHS0354_041760 [Potamilus streckersoni]|uniref:Amine oxidase domain-containing protein n=1 Tax=Potamilus streckersoni TaxID=2493646 RepID=A0AAE0T187_9BIVA|nr:hypothetical protein CHS0354_041760 [Potamilus streckersoni]
MADRKVRIVVVGAGAAGLSATCRLLEAGFSDVIILEASDRMGGRINTVKFGKGEDHIVELGANWIHGPTAENSTFTVANEHDLLRPYKILDRFSANFIKENGEEIDRSLVSKALQIYRKLDAEVFNKERRGSSPNQNLYEKAVPAFQAELDTIPEGERKDVSRALQAMLNYSRFHNGDELEKISASGLADYIELPGGDLRIPLGYMSVLKKIAKDFPASTIRYNCEVLEIRWQERSRLPIRLVCRDGIYTADHVIITCSLGYLKKHKDRLFNPELPAHKKRAIDTVGFGRVDKIFLQYKEPFMDPGFVGIIFAWDDTAEVTCSTWYKRIFGIDAVDNNPNVLVAWLAGDGAEHMETLSEEEIEKVCTDLLRKFLPGRTVPKPERVLVTRWCSNPYTLGSYSYPGMEYRHGDMLVMAEPLCHQDVPRVLFAGEATHDRFFSCTHGARSSGIREADRLIEWYSKRKAQARL